MPSPMSSIDEDKYPGPVEGDTTDKPAEERHDVADRHRGSKGSSVSGSGGSKPKRKRSCPVYFGVKSYLHNFYEDHTFKDPSVYEDDDRQYLLEPSQRRRRCTPMWWKIFMWLGVILLMFGVTGILVGYLVPPRHVIITSPDDPNGDAYVDENAQQYNTTLDMCKLVGLVLFCIGGVTVAMALLFPSFLSTYCVEETLSDGLEPIKVSASSKDVADDNGPASPLDMGIPVSGQVKNVQPVKKEEQQMLTQTTAAASATATQAPSASNE